MELISIIVPVYNINKYVEKCLISLMNQTYKALEILCINDGSTDDSLDILEKLSKKDSRIKIISQPNKGLSAARNTGIANAKGDYIVFVDGDDWVDIEMCQKAYKIISETNVDIVLWSYVKEYPNKAKKQLILGEKFILFDQNQTKQLHRRLFGLIGDELAQVEQRDTLVTAWGKMYKRSVIQDIKFVDTEKIGTEDALYNICVFGRACSIAYMPECLYHYRKDNENSLTTIYNEDLFDRWQHLYDYMYKYIEIKKMPEEYRQGLYNRVALSVIALSLNTIASQKNFIQKKNGMNRILRTTRYRKALKQLNTDKMPLHWKLFFRFAKKNCGMGIILLAYLMQFLRGK